MNRDSTAPMGIPYREKLLSHRLLGFGDRAQSREALERIGKRNVPYYEIDTRVSADGRVFIHDTPSFIDATGRRRVISQTPSAVVEALAGTLAEVPTLEFALECIRDLTGPGQRLCLDIQDIGFERQHLDAVRARELEPRTIYLSSAPQVLLALARLGARSPLILSHLNLLRFGSLGRLAAGLVRQRALALGRHVLLGEDGFDVRQASRETAHRYTFVTFGLPPALLDVLAASGGGICVHHFLLCGTLVEMCRANGLQLWVYPATTPDDFRALARIPGVDVVFSQDAPAVLAGPIEEL